MFLRNGPLQTVEASSVLLPNVTLPLPVVFTLHLTVLRVYLICTYS